MPYRIVPAAAGLGQPVSRVAVGKCRSLPILTITRRPRAPRGIRMSPLVRRWATAVAPGVRCRLPTGLRSLSRAAGVTDPGSAASHSTAMASSQRVGIRPLGGPVLDCQSRSDEGPSGSVGVVGLVGERLGGLVAAGELVGVDVLLSPFTHGVLDEAKERLPSGDEESVEVGRT